DSARLNGEHDVARAHEVLEIRARSSDGLPGARIHHEHGRAPSRRIGREQQTGNANARLGFVGDHVDLVAGPSVSPMHGEGGRGAAGPQIDGGEPAYVGLGDRAVRRQNLPGALLIQREHGLAAERVRDLSGWSTEQRVRRIELEWRLLRIALAMVQPFNKEGVDGLARYQRHTVPAGTDE